PGRIVKVDDVKLELRHKRRPTLRLGETPSQRARSGSAARISPRLRYDAACQSGRRGSRDLALMCDVGRRQLALRHGCDLEWERPSFPDPAGRAADFAELVGCQER